ncbi:amidohydrolase family protein [Phycicoccus sonneratiae]|uniref:Amidohydrolase family protein n=1 Tax=Phycicoccus sonneratiae TaxID=2807628 RepID=A0ABS2CQI9_9MICO|nr:amidohydrolase family protein [Phycicoccus sonneraticus]MBM6402155.1 amidohydrolase family protein [Phycicoccus sonneraticus]
MHAITRRTLFAGAGATALAATTTATARAARPAPEPTPFSVGSNRPSFVPPHGSVDSHIHIFEPERFPYPSPTATPPPRATVADYRLLQARLGTEKAVIVTPSNYATDNRCTLDAIAQIGQHHARGIAVVAGSVSDAELQQLHAGGIRGIRFNLTRPGGAGAELIRPLAARVADLGWHVQIHMTAEGILENLQLLEDLPVDLVIDHMGRIPGAVGTSHPTYTAILGLVEQGHTWVKVSGVYHESVSGPPLYEDRSAIGRAFVNAAPERVVWGSDWPHPTASRGEVPMPNDADMLSLLKYWAPNHGVIHRVLVDNPNTLYGFTTGRHGAR